MCCFSTILAARAEPVPRCVLAAAGVGLFGLRSSSKVTRKLASPNAPLGYTLCLVNLVLDGYTNAAQVGLIWRACNWVAEAGVHGQAVQAPRSHKVRRLGSVLPHTRCPAASSRLPQRRVLLMAGVRPACAPPL